MDVSDLPRRLAQDLAALSEGTRPEHHQLPPRGNLDLKLAAALAPPIAPPTEFPTPAGTAAVTEISRSSRDAIPARVIPPPGDTISGPCPPNP
jgi:hypothetical protein